jgi:hypothetical protein
MAEVEGTSTMKSASELSPSTFNRKKREGKLTWTKLFSDSVLALMNPNVSDRARSLWLLIQPILGEHDGFLRDINGDPHTAASLALRLFCRGNVDSDLRKLIKLGILEEENGVVYCPFMTRDKGTLPTTTTGNIGGVAKCNDDLVTMSIGNPSENSDTVEYSRVEESRGEFVGTANNYSTTTRQTVTKPQQGVVGWASPPTPFAGLTETELKEVFAQFPHLDCGKVYAKFAAHHASKGTPKVTKAILTGWFKREKTGAPAETTATEPAVTPIAAPARRRIVIK